MADRQRLSGRLVFDQPPPKPAWTAAAASLWACLLDIGRLLLLLLLVFFCSCQHLPHCRRTVSHSSSLHCYFGQRWRRLLFPCSGWADAVSCTPLQAPPTVNIQTGTKFAFADCHCGRTAFNHSSSNDAEAEYDRLRDLARAEAQKRNSCFDRVRAYLSQLAEPAPL